jgi:hypothetical protein
MQIRIDGDITSMINKKQTNMVSEGAIYSQCKLKRCYLKISAMLVCSNLGTSQDDQEAILPVVRVLALNS